MNTACCFTIFYNIVVTVYFIYTVRGCNRFIGRAVFCKDIPICRSIWIVLDKTSTSIHIGVSTKIISLAFNFNPHTSIIARTITISCTSSVCNPSTTCRSIFIKNIFDSVDSLLANIKLIIIAGKAVTVISILPSSFKNTVDRIVKIAIHLEHACSGLINKSTVFVCTYKLTVNDYVIMSNLNLSTKVNYRLTCFTVSSVFVTCFSSGCFLIKNSKFCIVNVVRRRNCCKFCCNIDRSCEGILSVENTANNFNINVYNGFITH